MTSTPLLNTVSNDEEPVFSYSKILKMKSMRTFSRCILFLIVVQVSLALSTLVLSSLNYHTLNSRYSGSSSSASSDFLDRRRCSTLVIGGGIAGLYMAEQLANSTKETSVCLIEREAFAGGRIVDKVFPQVPDAVAGMGAWRFDAAHLNIKNLADRLKINYTTWNFVKSNKMEARGIFTNDTTDTMILRREAFPIFAASALGNVSDDDLWDYVTANETMKSASLYPDFGSYLRDKLTPEGWQYLQSVRAYEGDLFEVDANSYVEFWSYEKQDTGYQYRPVGGMSDFIRQLQLSCDKLGVRMYFEEPARSIGRSDTGTYVVLTDTYYFETDRLVIDLPPLALAKVEGSIPEQITQQLAFQSILPEIAMKGVALYAEAWWEKLPENVRITDLQRYVTHSECLTTVLPYTGRGPNGEAVLHTIYADGPCATHWQRIVGETKTSLDAAVKRQLKYIFQNYTVPDSLQSEYALWDEGAWHFQKPLTGFSLIDIENWAAQPVENLPIHLVGEAYNRRRTWSEGAIRSAKDVLLKHWNIVGN